MSQERELTKCPNCKTRTLTRDGSELVCSECKGRFSAPEPCQVKSRPGRKGLTRKGLIEKHRYYEQNKAAIIHDLFTLGNVPTMHKWGLVSSSLHSLKNRWLTKAERDSIARFASEPPVPTNEEVMSHALPSFPEFSNSWEPEVQLEWLKVYGNIKGAK